MKQIIIIAIVFAFLSCGNQKETIVEQIKSYNDSLKVIAGMDAELTKQKVELSEKYRDSIEGLEFGSNKLSELLKRKMTADEALYKKQSPARMEIYIKKINFQSKIDSLELELKKY